METCIVCRQPKAKHTCGLCETPLCRSCAEAPHPEAFLYAETRAPELSHLYYCPNCFDETVAPAQEAYKQTLERAVDVGVWAKKFKGNIPVLGKAKERISVAECEDPKLLTLRLGFRAAELGYNGVKDVDIVERPTRTNGYKKTYWSGSGLPVNVDMAQVEREEYREAHWRVLHHR